MKLFGYQHFVGSVLALMLAAATVGGTLSLLDSITPPPVIVSADYSVG